MQCWYTEWSVFTCSLQQSAVFPRPRHSPLSAFAPALTEQHKPLLTTSRQTASRHNHLFVVSRPVCSEVSREQGLNHTRRGRSLTGESVPQRSENKLVSRVETQGKKKQRSMVLKCFWVTPVSLDKIYKRSLRNWTQSLPLNCQKVKELNCQIVLFSPTGITSYFCSYNLHGSLSPERQEEQHFLNDTELQASLHQKLSDSLYKGSHK